MIKQLKKRLGFRAKGNQDLDAATDIPPNGLSEASEEVEEQREVTIIDNQRATDCYMRDLSLGGGLLLGLGAKRILLQGLLVGHPVLFAVTASTTVVTGSRYLRDFWHGIRGERDLNGETLAGTVSMATLAISNGVPALSGVWLLNLGRYLQARRASGVALEKRLEEQPLALQMESERVAKWLSFASWGVSGLSVAHYLVQQRIAQLAIQLAEVGTINQLLSLVGTSRYGPLMYILFYAAQPPFLFSESLLTVAGGWLFGPVWGLAYAIMGSSAQTIVTYSLARYFGPRLLDKLDSKELIERYTEPMRENPFETILTMRFLFIPEDLVNTLAGTLQIDRKPFLLASMLGSLPSTISLVLFGSSIQGNSVSGLPHLNFSTIAASGGILVSSIAVSRYLKGKKDDDDMTENLTYSGAA